jgi:phosphoserine phosphatase RsbU/P
VFSSFRTKLFALISLILLLAAVTFMLITRAEVEKQTLENAHQAARDELSLALLNIENEHRSLAFHRQYALERYKIQLNNMVSAAVHEVETLHGFSLTGQLTEQKAKRAAIESIEKLRYGHNDYFYIFDDRFFAVAHPDPALRGTDMTNFQDVKGNYAVRRFPQITAKTGAGYFSHWHIRLGETKPVEKLSYIRYFRPWKWYIGTGVYIDDIESDTQKKMGQILQVLKNNFDHLKIGQTGYFFLFEGKGKMLIHPNMAGMNVLSFRHPVTGVNHFQEMIRASKTPLKPYVYLWDRPEDRSHFQYWKESYVRHFEPLDWYIASTVYVDELKAPARKVIFRQFLFTALIFLVSLGITYVFVNKISQPLKELNSYTKEVVQDEFTTSSFVREGLSGLKNRYRDEIGKLAAAFEHMIQALDAYIVKFREATAARERIESELRIAHQIQMNMVPRHPIKAPDFDLFAALEPARNVGGDFYDFFFLNDKYLLCSIGDVSDKGIPAALFMAKSKTLQRAIALNFFAEKQELQPHQLLHKMNEELLQDNDLCMFVTFFCAILNRSTGQLHYSNAGHNRPYQIAIGGKVKMLERTGGAPLGVREMNRYQTRSLQMNSGDKLFLYTDGVVEAENPTGAAYGEQRLQQCLSQSEGLTSAGTVESVLKDLKSFVQSAPQSDDIGVLALRYFG